MTTFIIKQLKKNQKGFTLIELLAVIVILGIIAAIAVPMVSRIIGNSKADADIATGRQIYDAARLAVTTELNGDFKGKTINIKGGTGEITGVATASAEGGLISKGYLESTMVLPSTKNTINGGIVTFKDDGTLDNITILAGAAVAGGTTVDNKTFNLTQLIDK
ncbi:type II secretion system protein [Paenibacillus psychroresistens]|uniref:Type II secretion system protein n=1 Tax=Paenibacillus psychroresistens TaxID=1778678 RepID=A0A6B8RKX6_9BACL|nr:type II secretion system protein [Paenibacillus psychroresistens]QGQ96689.1 type II secretion system protein [Paenibacillus psychroresistens]